MISTGETVSPNGQELLAEFMQYGRQRPFEEITRRYAGMVFSVCLRVTKDKHDAEDATQAVFLTLPLQAKRGTEIVPLGPWLQQVAKRLSLDMRRSKKRRKTREERHFETQTLRQESSADGSFGSLPAADLDEIKTILHEELNKLPSKYRMPLILHYFGGLSRDEMAEELKCKPSTLGVRIFRGREMLAGRLSGRGVSISLGTFAVMMAYTIKSAVSNAMISSTSHAASALACGGDGIGLVSGRVIGLTRRAASAAAISKLKLATIVLILAGTALGAGAKVMGVLPNINIQQIISNQIRRLIRPMTDSISLPLRVDATPASPSQKPADLQVAIARPFTLDPSPILQLPANSPAGSSTASSSLPTIARSPDASSAPVSYAAAWLTKPADWSAAVSSHPSTSALTSLASSASTLRPTAAPSIAAASASAATASASENGITPAMEAASAGTSGNTNTKTPELLAAKSDPLVVPTTTDPSMTAYSANDLALSGGSAGGGGSPQSITIGRNSYAATSIDSPAASSEQFMNFVSGTVASPLASTTSTKSTSLIDSPADSTAIALNTDPTSKIIRIPAINGNVTESNGVLSGYGKIDRTGTLDIGGEVIAYGGGVDRTLDLTSFKTICNDLANPSQNGTAGWYAQARGRLILPLKPGVNPSTLIWGEDPTDPTLNLVNSVRLRLLASPSSTADQPTSLSLLSTDRQDLPPLTGLNGLPIGLWKVDTDAGDLAETNVAVRYDSALVDSLGISESTLSLWTFGGDEWQAVDPNSFALDTTDHLISGTASDFNYFAVAIPSASANGPMTANPGDERALGIPEPAALGLFALAAALLPRRRKPSRPSNH